MKRLLSVTLLSLIASVAFGQTKQTTYNRTFIVVNDTMSQGADGVTTSYDYWAIPKATDIGVTASIKAFADSASGGDSLIVKYVLRNSKTGAVTAATLLDTLISTSDSTLEYQRLGTIALSSVLGYDGIRLTATKLAETGTTTNAARFKIYFNVVARAGELLGNEQGVTPAVNETKQFYYKTGYSSSTASDTLNNYIPIVGITDMRIFARSTDSLVATVYYKLHNRISGLTGSWTSLGTATHVQTSDTVTSVGTILLTTLLGYDEILFYIDYAANSTAESARVARLYHHFLRRE